MFLAWTNACLHNRVETVSHSEDLDLPAFWERTPIISGKFWHGKASMAILIFHNLYSREYFPFDYILGVGNCILLYSLTLNQLDRTLPQCAGNRKLIKPNWCGRRFKTREYFNGWIYPNAYGDRQGLSQFRGSVGHGTNMTAAGHQKDRELVFALDTHSMNCNIGDTGIRMRCITHSQCDKRACVNGGVCGRRDKRVQIKIGIGCIVNYFLTRSRRIGCCGRNRILHTVMNHLRQFILITSK